MSNAQRIEQKDRITWIDFVKGIGILLVLIAHSVSKDSYIWIYINQFHMPLFFCISGYLYSCKNSFYSFIKNKVISLYIPFVFCSILMTIIMSLLQVEPFSIKRIILIMLMLTSGPLQGAMWFIGVLFYSIIIYDLFNRIIQKNNWDSRFLNIICFIIFWGGGTHKISIPDFDNPRFDWFLTSREFVIKVKSIDEDKSSYVYTMFACSWSSIIL